MKLQFRSVKELSGRTKNYGIVFAEYIHMQVSSAGDRTEHVNDCSETARINNNK